MTAAPKYVMSVVVYNNYGTDLQVTGTYQSGRTETLALPPLPQGRSARIEHEYEAGSDLVFENSVKNVTVTSHDGAVLASHDFSSKGGVKNFEMTIGRDAHGNSHLEITCNEPENAHAGHSVAYTGRLIGSSISGSWMMQGNAGKFMISK